MKTSLKEATVRQWIGLAMMAGIAAWLIHRERYDGGIFIASLILQQLGMHANISKNMKISAEARAEATSAAQSGEFAVAALQKLTGAQIARMKENEDFEEKS